MIKLDWDKAAILLTQARLNQMSSKIRRRVMQKVANECSKPILTLVKGMTSTQQGTDNIPIVTGTMAKSLGKRAKGYAAGSVAFVAVGPKRGFKQTVTEYKDYRTGQMRKWKQGQPKKGPRVQVPSKYAHLVGKGRSGRWKAKAASATKAQVRSIAKTVLTEEVRMRS